MAAARRSGIEHHRRRFRVTWWSDGVRYRRSFITEAAAHRFLESRHAAAKERLGERLAGALTVGEIVDNWYRDHRRNLSSGTRRDYEGRIRRDVARIASLDAEAVARNPRRIRELYTALSPTTARRLHAILRQAFQDAVEHGEISRNPCDVARARKPKAAERLVPTPQEVTKILVSAEESDPIWGLFLNVSATLGTRRGETCALRWDDVDFEARRVLVRRTVCKGADAAKELKPPKTGRERSLIVGRAFFDEIAWARRATGWVFTARDRDEPWHPDWPGHRFQRLMATLELPFTLHSLRHFVATQLLAHGMPVTQVAQFMGHKDPSVTMDLYANHVIDDVQRLMGDTAVRLFRRRATDGGGGT